MSPIRPIHKQIDNKTDEEGTYHLTALWIILLKTICLDFMIIFK